jgi:large conductance mechanosensitive channel
MGILKEFRDFAMRGNVMDMAIGIIIGAEFGKIVNSLVKDVLMPPLGYLIGGVDFTKLAIVMPVKNAEGVDVTINYGNFIQAIISFIIIAFAVFMLVKGMNKLKRKQEVAPPKPAETPADVVLLTEIRDLMMRQAR